MSSAIEKIIIERNKTADSAILGEIQKIAVENGVETKIVLNEKNVADALRNYQDGYAAIKSEVAREIFAEIETSLCYKFINGEIHLIIREEDYKEYKKKHTEGGAKDE